MFVGLQCYFVRQELTDGRKVDNGRIYAEDNHSGTHHVQKMNICQHILRKYSRGESYYDIDGDDTLTDPSYTRANRYSLRFPLSRRRRETPGWHAAAGLAVSVAQLRSART